MEGVEWREQRIPPGDKRQILAREDFCALQLLLEFGGGFVGEADVGGRNRLVEQRSAGEERELLLFDRIARRGENVAAA